MPKLKVVNFRIRLRIAAKMEIVLQSKAELLSEKERPAFYVGEYRRFQKGPKAYINHLLIEDWTRYRDYDWLKAIQLNLALRRNNSGKGSKTPLCASFPYVYRAFSYCRNLPFWVQEILTESEDRFISELSQFNPALTKELSGEDDEDEWLEDEIQRHLDKPD